MLTGRGLIQVEKDTYIQIGLGNPFNEVWKRFDGA